MTKSLEQRERLAIPEQLIILIGPEGSGKTTVAKYLAEELDLPYVTTGDMIRELAASDPGVLGDECRSMFEKHTYLSAESLLKILGQRLMKSDITHGCVIDGSLRTLIETEKFQEMLDEIGRNLPLTIFKLDIPVWTSFYRLVTEENEKARKRKDDTRAGVAGRLGKYYYQLRDRIRVIESEPNWSLTSIDAEAPIEDVCNQVYEMITSEANEFALSSV